MLTIVDLPQAQELSSSDMTKVAGGSPLGAVAALYEAVSAVAGAISTVANAGLDGAQAANGYSDPEPQLPGQHGGLTPLRSP